MHKDVQNIGRIHSCKISGVGLKEFDTQFESSFNLRKKGFSNAQIEMVLNALSSLIGGIGYFHGSGLVSSNPKPEYGHEDSSEAKLGEP
ncbi:Processing alpha glucosidase I, partial [Coemansia pectinata]